MIKRMAGTATAFINPKCKFERAVFILGHMRCGSTALSNILCSHQQISGYGEAHIRYDGNSALGMLVLNQLRRNAYRADARFLFDKILHSRYDSGSNAKFFESRAIFMLREPTETIRSVRRLFGTLGSSEYATDTLACDYYEQRVSSLLNLWQRFCPTRRIGLTYAQLTSEPDERIASISRMLGLDPQLSNSYTSPRNPLGHGAGDPLASHKFNKIIAATRLDHPDRLELPDSRLTNLSNLYIEASGIVTQV